ncbi:MFS transporter [Desulfosudis oleivorans]|uniref:Major facilitator superfamily MFS_1 n=1 Tax=Desulfosudis oleivorans (strain DSM 6200 / JCM 39069 / Hxd3) TaxID=96561 RepID=A8ZSZ9_DESOH|nr:glycoside-pentoside-hexuronide (GPH):cation symporter [Desulfosudis oleivorans]ABW66163.1 major facilitator superfamily MFS_1 [Desulfosudis oleivorans Hxd3]
MRHLTVTRKLAYSGPAFSLAVVGIPVYVYIPKFYTDVIGVPIGALGLILLLVRLFDAVTDPAMGYISDRLKTPFGRRRPLIAAGAVLTVAAMALLFNPPAGLGTAAATAWFAVMVAALFLFWTVIIVPYESLGPELTYDYNERTALFGMRDGALIAGTLVAAASPAIVKALWHIGETAEDFREVFHVLSLLYGPLILASAAWCVLSFRERTTVRPETAAPFFSGMASSLQNRPFRILLISYTISAIGSNLPATLILYYVEYVLHSPRADLFLLIYFVTGILLLPLWVAGAKRFEKKNMWLAAMAVNTGAFFGVFFLGPGDEWAYGVLVAISGMGFGASLAIPSAMQADVIDYDQLQTGLRREGVYIGFWSVAKKLAAAVGVGAGLALLGVSGYDPTINQSPAVVTTLRVLYTLVPCLCNLVAMAVAWRYPLTREVHQQIHRQIQRRLAGEPFVDPLASAGKASA